MNHARISGHAREELGVEIWSFMEAKGYHFIKGAKFTAQ